MYELKNCNLKRVDDYHIWIVYLMFCCEYWMPGREDKLYQICMVNPYILDTVKVLAGANS